MRSSHSCQGSDSIDPKATMAARWTAAKKFLASSSERVATRLKSLNRQKQPRAKQIPQLRAPGATHQTFKKGGKRRHQESFGSPKISPHSANPRFAFREWWTLSFHCQSPVAGSFAVGVSFPAPWPTRAGGSRRRDRSRRKPGRGRYDGIRRDSPAPRCYHRS